MTDEHYLTAAGWVSYEGGELWKHPLLMNILRTTNGWFCWQQFRLDVRDAIEDAIVVATERVSILRGGIRDTEEAMAVAQSALKGTNQDLEKELAEALRERDEALAEARLYRKTLLELQRRGVIPYPGQSEPEGTPWLDREGESK